MSVSFDRRLALAAFLLGVVAGWLAVFLIASSVQTMTTPHPRLRDDCKILVGCAGYDTGRQLVLCPA